MSVSEHNERKRRVLGDSSPNVRKGIIVCVSWCDRLDLNRCFSIVCVIDLVGPGKFEPAIFLYVSIMNVTNLDQ